MKINRVNTIDKFSTFLLLSDTQKNIFTWHKDSKLKLNFEKITQNKIVNAENIAYQFLNQVREKKQPVIITNHLTSYLQEACYWAARQVYNQKQTTLNLLTLEECFSSGNEATATPEKILKKYQINGGSRITTYAQTRLKTIIGDNIYRHRQWKLLSNWGLLRKISKSKRQQVLVKVGGLKAQQLAEYLLVWQCYIDNIIYSDKAQNNRLSAPNSAQLKLMMNQYNLLAKKTLTIPRELTVDEFKTRLEWCGDKARIFENPQIVSYEKEQKINLQIDNSKLDNILENTEDENFVTQILTDTFTNLSANLQAIIYLYLGLNLTQQQVISIIQVTAPNFLTQQYQFSRKINSIKKILLDSLIKQITNQSTTKLSTDKKILLQFVQQWLEEYVESQMLLLVNQSYQQIDRDEQQILKNDYYQQSLNKNTIVNQLKNILEQTIVFQLKIKFTNNQIISNSLDLWLEKFFHQHFNQITNHE